MNVSIAGSEFPALPSGSKHAKKDKALKTVSCRAHMQPGRLLPTNSALWATFKVGEGNVRLQKQALQQLS